MRRLCAIWTFILAAAPGLQARVVLQFRARVDPDRIILRCFREGAWPDRQLLYTNNLTSQVQKVRDMMSAGYRARETRPGTFDVFVNQAASAEDVRLLQLRAGADRDGGRLSWRVGGAERRTRWAPPGTRPYLKPATRDAIDRFVRDTYDDAQASVEQATRFLDGLRLGSLSFSASERGRIQESNGGTIRKPYYIRHCGERHDFTVTIQWRRIVTDIPGEGRPF